MVLASLEHFFHFKKLACKCAPIMKAVTCCFLEMGRKVPRKVDIFLGISVEKNGTSWVERGISLLVLLGISSEYPSFKQTSVIFLPFFHGYSKECPYITVFSEEVYLGINRIEEQRRHIHGLVEVKNWLVDDGQNSDDLG